MPVLKGAVTFARFRVVHGKDDTKDLQRSMKEALQTTAFEALDPTSDEDRSAGWVELEDSESTEFGGPQIMFGDYLMVAWRVDTLRVPAPRVKAEMDRWIKVHEAEKGEPPNRASKKAQKEIIIKQLRGKAFPASRTYDITWNLEKDTLLMWTPARKILEEVQIALEDGFGLHLIPQSPGALTKAANVSGDDIQPTPQLFGSDVVKEAKIRVGS